MYFFSFIAILIFLPCVKLSFHPGQEAIKIIFHSNKISWDSEIEIESIEALMPMKKKSSKRRVADSRPTRNSED